LSTARSGCAATRDSSASTPTGCSSRRTTQPPGGRSTDHTDYPAALTPYTLRDPHRIIRQAEAHGVHLGRFAAALLGGTFPWTKLRQAQRLLRLGDKYGWARVDGACQRALAFELVNVKRVETILRLELDQRDQRDSRASSASSAAAADEPRVFPLRPRFARPDTSFAHPTPSTLSTRSTPVPSGVPATPHTAQEMSHERSEILS
jgi:hypothetical protein